MRTATILCWAFALLLLPTSSFPWKAELAQSALPEQFIAVDKEKQRFFFLHADLSCDFDVVCTTGKMPGDKQVLHDLKTPEGIYFVQKHIPRGLDFREYGGRAYTLDYPNPVDILRGKTGGGIWIHSKGYGLVPTRGCVAISLEDLASAGKRIRRGMPVLIAQTIDTAKNKENVTANALKKRMRDWASAWSARSQTLFSFYDAKSYSRTTESFDAFRANKERIFANHGPIELKTREIHVLEGPGYWVTIAEQTYSSVYHKSAGLRILYWMPKGKTYQIVGMRWMTTDTWQTQSHEVKRISNP